MAKKKSRKKNKSNLYKVLSAIFCFLTVILAFLIFSLNILPSRYIFITVTSLVVVNFIVYLILRFSNNFITKCIYFITCGIFLYGIYSLSNTYDILNAMNNNIKTNQYVVIVNKDSNYESIKDLKYKSIGYFLEDKDYLKKLKIVFESIKYDDIDILANDLLDKKIDAIVIEKSYADILSEENKNIKNNTKIIYTFEINTKIKKIVKEVNTTKDCFSIYISGIDTYGSISTSSRSDANILLIVNPNINQILMISIPRDYYVELDGKNEKDKLTHSGIYGIDNTVKTVENLLGIDINYYYKINFTSFIDIVNSLGGVDVYSKYTFTSKDGYNYAKGYNHVNGKEALSFARERKAFSAGDKVRGNNQQALIEAMIRKATNKDILIKYNDILNSLKGSFVTNMSQKNITSLIKKQIDTNSKWNITSFSLDGTSSREYTYSYKNSKLYVMLPNVNSISKAKLLIKEVYKGNKLDNSYTNNVTDVHNVTSKKNNKVSNSNSTIILKNEFKVVYVIDDKKYEYIVKEGDLLDNVNIPYKPGYRTLGWYNNDTLYDFNIPVTNDITLVAKYELDTNENNTNNYEDIIEDNKEKDINTEN